MCTPTGRIESSGFTSIRGGGGVAGVSGNECVATMADKTSAAKLIRPFLGMSKRPAIQVISIWAPKESAP